MQLFSDRRSHLSVSSSQNITTLILLCIIRSSVSNAECNNRGECECGRCACNEPSSVVMSTVNNMTRYNVTDSLLLGSDATVVLVCGIIMTSLVFLML